MKKVLIILAAILITASSAYAEGVAKAPAQFDSGKLTVLQVLNIGVALRQFGDYRGPDGKTISVGYRFSGDMMLDISVNIAAADTVQRNVENARNGLVKQYVGEDGNKLREANATAAKEKDPAKKKQLEADNEILQAKVDGEVSKVNEEMQKVYDKEAGALLVRFKRKEFCIDAKADGKPIDGCPAVNVISPSLMAPLMVITDR